MKDNQELLLEGIFAMLEEVLQKMNAQGSTNEALVRLEKQLITVEQKCDKQLARPMITLEQTVEVCAQIIKHQKIELEELTKLVQGIYIYIDKKVKPLMEKSVELLEEKKQKRWWKIFK